MKVKNLKKHRVLLGEFGVELEPGDIADLGNISDEQKRRIEHTPSLEIVEGESRRKKVN